MRSVWMQEEEESIQIVKRGERWALLTHLVYVKNEGGASEEDRERTDGLIS